MYGRNGHTISDRQCHRVMKQHDLLRRTIPRKAWLYRVKKQWELQPKAPNDLWQWTCWHGTKVIRAREYFTKAWL